MRNIVYTSILGLALVACGEKSEDTASAEETEETTEETENTEETEETEETTEPDLTNGQSIHDAMCMGCHANNPDMAENSPSLSDSELESVIQNGSGSMPGQGLSDTDLRDVIAYLRATYGG